MIKWEVRLLRQKRYNRYIFFLPFIAVFILLLFQYFQTFLQGDDFTFIARGGTLANAWNYYKYYYSVAGSRMANLLAQILLFQELHLWRILTPFVITALSFLLFYYTAGHLFAKGASYRRDMVLACVCAGFPGLIPVSYHMLSDTLFWMDGSMNYLYPLFLMLAGFIPFYNAVRERETPAFFYWISPFCLVASGLLHEQTALMISGMCAVTFLFIYRRKQKRWYFGMVCVLMMGVLVYTFTCPGAYYRFSMVTGAQGAGLVSEIARGILLYLYPFGNDYWPWTILLGICALLSCRRKTGKCLVLLRLFLGIGIVLAPVSHMLNLPLLRGGTGNGGFAGLIEISLAVYWVLYFAAVFTAFCISSFSRGGYRYLVVLQVGLWMSQALPIILGSWGRPVLHLVFLTLLTALCCFYDLEFHRRWIDLLHAAVAVVALCTMLHTSYAVLQNRRAYREIETQIAAAKKGECDMIIFDTKKFNMEYCYHNAFHPAYEKEIRKCYGIPQTVRIQFR